MITRQDLIDNGYEDVLLIGDKDDDTAIEWIEANVVCTHFSEGNEPIFITDSFVNFKKDSMEIAS